MSTTYNDQTGAALMTFSLEKKLEQFPTYWQKNFEHIQKSGFGRGTKSLGRMMLEKSLWMFIH